jgi:hypothetical protein
MEDNKQLKNWILVGEAISAIILIPICAHYAEKEGMEFFKALLFHWKLIILLLLFIISTLLFTVFYKKINKLSKINIFRISTIRYLFAFSFLFLIITYLSKYKLFWDENFKVVIFGIMFLYVIILVLYYFIISHYKTYLFKAKIKVQQIELQTKLNEINQLNVQISNNQLSCSELVEKVSELNAKNVELTKELYELVQLLNNLS